MGYRDDFYCTDNVIGYSGTLHEFPSVYFESDSEYGHITQKHDDPQNVGRQLVESNEGYAIGNKLNEEGELKLMESLGGEVVHESRSIFKAVDEMTAGDKAVLFQAIWKYPQEKNISSYSQKDFKTIDKTRARHELVMRQIRKRGRKKKAA